jgi:hypothetical protein
MAHTGQNSVPNNSAITFSVVAVAAALLPRLLAVWRFRQPLVGALLHPLVRHLCTDCDTVVCLPSLVA